MAPVSLNPKTGRNTRGFTMTEIILVVAIMIVFAILTTTNLLNRRNQTQLDSATRQIATMLRDAQAKSSTQASSTAWGVHLENSTTTRPFFAMFASGVYSASTTVSYQSLPQDVAFATTSIALGSFLNVNFDQLSGFANATATIGLYRISDPAKTATIIVTPNGTVSF